MQVNYEVLCQGCTSLHVALVGKMPDQASYTIHRASSAVADLSAKLARGPPGLQWP